MNQFESLANFLDRRAHIHMFIIQSKPGFFAPLMHEKRGEKPDRQKNPEAKKPGGEKNGGNKIKSKHLCIVNGAEKQKCKRIPRKIN